MTTPKAIPPGALRKRCTCPKADRYRCGDPWYFVMRCAAAPNGRIYTSIIRWLKDRNDPRANAEKMSKAEALVIAAEILASVTGHANPTTPAATSPAPASTPGRTFADLGVHYLTDRAADRPDDAAPDQDRLRVRVLGRIAIDGTPVAEWPVTRFTKEHAATMFRIATTRSGKTTRGNSSRRKYRGTIQRLFAWAVRHEWIAATPITDKFKAGQPAIRKRRVSVETETALIRAAESLGGFWGPWLARLIVFATDCGARLGELLAIKVADVNLARRVIHITAQERGARKTGKWRPVPISDRMLPILHELIDGRPPTAYLFGDEIGRRVTPIRMRRLWQLCVLLAHGVVPAYQPAKVSKQNLTAACWAELKRIDLHFHDLRHEAAHRWHEGSLGKPLELTAIADLLGHADLRLLRIYLGIEHDDALAAYARAAGLSTTTTSTAKPAHVVPFNRKRRAS